MSTVTVLSIINRLNILVFYLDGRTEKALSLSRTSHENMINAKRNVMDNDDDTNGMEEKSRISTRTLRAKRSRSMTEQGWKRMRHQG